MYSFCDAVTLTTQKLGYILSLTASCYSKNIVVGKTKHNAVMMIM